MGNGKHSRTITRLTATGISCLLAVAFISGVPALADFSVTDSTANAITLTWTAPGDDLDVGTASLYDLRYSYQPITEANWGQASRAVGEPSPKVAGSTETFTVAGLYPDTLYYFAIKAADEIPNWSVLSPVITGHTLEGSPPPDTTHTGECTNVALGLTATVSGLYSGYSVEPITDGQIAPRGGAATTTATDDTPGTPHWIEVNFGTQKTIQAVEVHWAWNEYRSEWMTSRQYSIQTWNGASFEDISVVNNITADSSTATAFPNVSTSRIRIYQPADMGPSAYPSVLWLTELEVCGLAPIGNDTTGPGISAGSVENVTPISVTVTWNTDEPATSQVQYGLTSQYGTSTAIDYTQHTDNHRVDLYSLTPATTYHYRAVSIDSSGNLSHGPDMVFTTLSLGAGEGGTLVSASPQIYRVLHPSLRVANLDNNPDNLYVFDVARDSLFTDMVVTSTAVQQQAGGSTAWKVSDDLEIGETYFWKVVLNSLVTGGVFEFTIEPETFAYPNPFRLSEVSQVIFAGVPDNSNLVILTVSGELVRRWVDQTGGEITWDGTNDSGNPVASGTYLWYIENSAIRGKIMVIR